MLNMLVAKGSPWSMPVVEENTCACQYCPARPSARARGTSRRLPQRVCSFPAPKCGTLPPGPSWGRRC
eukprot:7392380-Prorocentrum_lima.AAC.1